MLLSGKIYPLPNSTQRARFLLFPSIWFLKTPSYGGSRPGPRWENRELRKQVFEGQGEWWGRGSNWCGVQLGKLGPRIVGTCSLLLTASQETQGLKDDGCKCVESCNLTKDCPLQRTTESIDSKTEKKQAGGAMSLSGTKNGFLINLVEQEPRVKFKLI